MAHIGSYEILPHTADLEIQVKAATKVGLLYHVLPALEEISGAVTLGEDTGIQAFHLVAVQDDLLLVDFISDCLLWMFGEFNLVSGLSDVTWDGNILAGKAITRPVRYFQKEIKAVTFHEAALKNSPLGYWECRLIFDI